MDYGEEFSKRTYCCIWPDFCASYARTRSSSDERSRSGRRLGAFFAAPYDDRGQSGLSSTISRFMVSGLQGQSGHAQSDGSQKRRGSSCRSQMGNKDHHIKVQRWECGACEVDSRIGRGRGRVVVVAITGIYQHQDWYSPHNPHKRRVYILPNGPRELRSCEKRQFAPFLQ